MARSETVVVGLDARHAIGPTREQPIGAAGRGRYVYELAKRLPYQAPDARFILYGRTQLRPDGLAANVEWRPVESRGLSWHWRTARKARDECAIYFSTTSYVTPHFLPRYVQTVFDVITFKGSALPHRRSSRVERLTLRRALARATRILAISDATASDLAEILPEVADKVTVTPLAADERFRPDRTEEEVAAVKRQYGLPEAFVLATGTIEPRKNLVRLVEAYAALPSELRRRYGLVLVGRRGWQWEGVFDAIAALDDASVRHLEFVPDDDLARIYAGATAFCYPSLHEGFGLPVLEAMQSGTPVITSNVSSLPEVGGDAVRYVDPHDLHDLSAALAEVLSDEARREVLRKAGLERAKQFSWEKTAAQTMEVLRAAA